MDTFYVGSKVVHQAKRRLERGEAICVSYGVNFAADPLEERRDFLKNSYRFDCFCERCRRELKGEKACPHCGAELERTVFKTLACRACDVDEDGEFLTEDCFDFKSYAITQANSFCAIA